MRDKARTKEHLIGELEELRRRIAVLEAGHSSSHELYNRFFILSKDMLCIAGLDGYLKLFNPVFEKKLGYTKEELYSKPFTEFIHPQDRSPGGSIIEKLKTDKYITYFENRFICKDGSCKLLGWNLYIDYSNQYVYAVVLDITERREVEEELIKSRNALDLRIKERTAELTRTNDEFHALLDAIPDNLIRLAPDLKILWLNKAAALTFGRDASELYGRYCYELCCSTFVPCDNCPALTCFLTGKEETVLITTSQDKVWDIRAFPVRDESGVKNVIEVARDVTAKVRMEQESRLMQGKLIHANKMTSLGTLVSGVVHEINNPNSYIMSNAQLFADIWKDTAKALLKHYREKEDFRLGGILFSKLRRTAPEMLEGIIDGSVRIKNIITNLKDFARPERAGLYGKVDIRKTIRLSRSMIENQIEMFTDNFGVVIAKNLPFARGNAQQIEQVIVNLIMNSLQALHAKNCSVRVSVSLNATKDSILIKVIDEGVGMTREVLDKATEPFFTTRSNMGGTGLGLSISYAIIKEHGGSLDFESEPGRGTTATVRLPLYKE